jgi:predicted lipid-binding transport protein (Tim44 family)
VAGKGKPPLVLYSTQTYLKFRIQQDFIGKHWVWCSQIFDAEKQNPYALGAVQAPSSDPKSIYIDLAKAVARTDHHNAKIANQKTVLSGLVEGIVLGIEAETARLLGDRNS